MSCDKDLRLKQGGVWRILIGKGEIGYIFGGYVFRKTGLVERSYPIDGERENASQI